MDEQGLTIQLIDALSRHVLTALAGVMVSRGYATQDQATAIVGGCLALISVVWSFRNKHANATAVKTALNTPVPVPLDQPKP
jgi:hypothetical protein